MKWRKKEYQNWIKNIVHLGVSTFEWTFLNRNIQLPEIKPFISLNLPSETHISYNELDDDNFIRGSAVEFCQVVTQVRNIDDTNLNVVGDVATSWMKYAQCFAGKPEDPPQKGTRYIQKI